jgi:hypothetical protein
MELDARRSRTVELAQRRFIVVRRIQIPKRLKRRIDIRQLLCLNEARWLHVH